jgi:hypothetical protein
MLAAFTVMSTVAVTPVFAAGNTATMSFDYCYDSAGNTIVYAADLVINGHTVNEAGKPGTRSWVMVRKPTASSPVYLYIPAIS